MASGAYKRGVWRVRPTAADRVSRRFHRNGDDLDWSRDVRWREGFLRRHPAIRIGAKLLLLVVVAVLAGGAGLLLGYLTNTVGSLQSNDWRTVQAAKKHLVPAPAGSPVTVLFLGSDRARPSGPGHVDSMLLARLDPASHETALLFIPRDLLAAVPGHGRQPIAAAYRLGGAVLALETIESLTDVPVNHFLDIDFQGFIDIVDTLGGVHVVVPSGLGTPPGPSWASAPLQPGPGLLDGRQLLTYVRLEEDAYGGEGWLADQGTILAQVRSRLASQVDWTHPRGTLRLLKQATRNAVSDIAGLRSWYHLVRLVASPNEHVSQVRLTGHTVKTGHGTIVIATPALVKQAVQAFLARSSGSGS